MCRKLATGAKIFHNQIFCYHICILLVNTNQMIYIYYIIYEGNTRVCMLAVGDDELSVGNSDGTLCGGCQRWWYMCMRQRNHVDEWTGELASESGYPWGTVWRNVIIVFFCYYICILLMDTSWMIYILYNLWGEGTSAHARCRRQWARRVKQWRRIVWRLLKEMIHAHETRRNHMGRWPVSQLWLLGSFGESCEEIS